jgi:hypothetical protein
MTGKEYHYLNQNIKNLEERAKKIDNDVAGMVVTEPDAADRDRIQFMEGTANGLRLAIDQIQRTLTALNA